MNRLTDNDKNYGPLTIARCEWAKAFFIYLSSGGDDEDEEGYRNHIRLQAFNWAIRLALPNLIRPLRGRYQNHPREYGFKFMEGDSFTVLCGVQDGFGCGLPDGVKEKRFHWFLPWMMWRHIRTSVYDTKGEHFATEDKNVHSLDWMKIRDRVPKEEFWFEDYDGEIIKATTHIEEREWLRGESWCSFLSVFFRPKIHRTLDIRFSRGSWKGGTIGHGIDMLPGELHESAFKRYCDKDHRSKSGTYRIKFLGEQKEVAHA